jgi:hypothetical protein
MEKEHTPTADELMANDQWVALFGGIYPSVLRRIAEGQAARAAAYFAAIANVKEPSP